MNNFLKFIVFVGCVSSIRSETSYPVAQPSSESTQTYVPSSSYQTSDTAALLENQAYDPTLYTSFMPQDAVQQYVNSYGVGNGYTGQTLEGFLIPALKQTAIAPLATPTFISFMKSYWPGPKFLIAIVAKIVALVGSTIGIVLFGGAITSFICSFTPLCTISILGRPLALLRKETKEIVDKIVPEVTAERIKRAADLLNLAVQKYQQMQKF